MKIKEFKYTKPNGEVSERTILELVPVSEHVEGVDISSLDMDAYAEFVSKVRAIEADTYAKYMDLYADFDLKHNYRRFSPERMTDVVVDHI